MIDTLYTQQTKQLNKNYHNLNTFVTSTYNVNTKAENNIKH